MKRTKSNNSDGKDASDGEKSHERCREGENKLKNQMSQIFGSARENEITIKYFPTVIIPDSDEPSSFPQLHSNLLDLSYDIHNCIDDLCTPNEIIGIIGQAKPIDIHIPSAGQIITISPQSQLNSLHALRPYSFSKVLVSNGFEQYKQRDIFQMQQELIIMAPKEKLELLVGEWAKYLQETQGNQLAREVLPKLIVRVSKVKDKWWVSLNCAPVEEYCWGKIGLCRENDLDLIDEICHSLTFNQLCSLIQQTKSRPSSAIKLSIRSFINDKTAQKIKPHEIPQALKQPSSIQSSNSQILNIMFSLTQQAEDIPERKYRSQSADITDESFQELMSRRNFDDI